MPMQTGKSSILTKLGDRFRQAAEQHKNDPVEVSGFNDLPAGILGGVAQLVECKFTQIAAGKQNAGEYMFYAAAIVKSPQEHNGQRVAGLRTQISEPIFDTPSRARKTIPEHVKEVQNHLKLLLGPRPNNAYPELGAETMEATMAALAAHRPHLKFRTWKMPKQVLGQDDKGQWWVYTEDDKGTRSAAPVAGKGPYKTQAAAAAVNPYAGKDSMVNHDWQGLFSYQDNGQAPTSAGGQTPSHVQDDSPPAADSNVETQPPADTGVTPPDVEVDLDALAIAAGEESNQDARDQLSAIAQEVGITEAEVNNKYQTWEELVAEIRARQAGAGAETPDGAPADEAVVPPKKDDMFFYKLLDPKTKRKRKVEIEVQSYDTKTDSITALNSDTKKLIMDGTTKKPLWIKMDDVEGE